ncbi:MAG: 30S ribosome-binding factor RbfA [Planctomycetes bacterium]|jgi:ribosome-binding factor A|nr:30S ribosome-binding factor RbfA [Planctomycetaceae bacterium]NBV63776.1 30S ribosome-binding factor RbfA [Planctomycetota bacterium]
MKRRDDDRAQDHGSERVVSALRRALQQALAQGLSDPRLDGTLVSVASASMSPDGQSLRVGISVLPETAGPRALGALRHASGHLKEGMAKHVEIRRMPRLEFELDDSLKRQAALDVSLAEVNPPAPHEGTP